MSRRLTPQERRDRDTSETEFRLLVDELAATLGYESMHVDPLRGAGGIWRTPTHGSIGKGWPDTVYVRQRDRRLVFVEFKAELGKVSPDQERVLGILRTLDVPLGRTPMPFEKPPRVEVYVWRPSDFDRIAAVLR